jgi:PadR family transcriptional regulator, regulatory protein PadR
VEEDESAVRKFQKELSAGTVGLVLLALLERAGSPMYGYQIAKQLEGAAQGALGMKQGTLYPVLRALESSGYLASEVEPSVAGPPRRYYAITDAGRETLARWKDVWFSARGFVDDLLAGSGPVPGRLTAEQEGGARG